MPTRNAAYSSFALPLKVLTEIPDAVIVTDNEQHIVYWNGPAEHLYGVTAPEVLGRPLQICCPELSFLIAQASLRHRGVHEVLLARAGKQAYLECSISPLEDSHGKPAGTLWIHRDITERKKLEAEVQVSRQLLQNIHAHTSPPTQPVHGGGSTSQVVLWAEDDDDDALLMSRAWKKAEVEDELVRVRDGTEAIKYLTGDGIYQDRAQYPLPNMLLLDIKMPRASGLDVLNWLQAQPTFRTLPVVILTSSAASADVHEAARLGVKGYLVKPVDTTEWVMKVKTLTCQCK